MKKSIKKAISKNVPVYTLMLPAILLLSLFSIYPIIYAVRYCFYEFDGFTRPLFIGLDNFTKLFSNNASAIMYWEAWPRTIMYGLNKLIIEIPLALICAFLIYKKIFGHQFFRALFYMPAILPGMVTGVIFINMLNPFNGIINTMLLNAGLIHEPYSFLSNPHSAFLAGVFIDIWGSFGTNMLFFLAALSGISKELYDSAHIDGANEKQTFIYIVLPGLARIGQIIILLAMVYAFRSMGAYFVLTQGGPNHSTELVFLRIYKLFFGETSYYGSTTARYGFGCAAAVVSAIILAGVAFIYNYFTKRLRED